MVVYENSQALTDLFFVLNQVEEWIRKSSKDG